MTNKYITFYIGKNPARAVPSAPNVSHTYTASLGVQITMPQKQRGAGILRLTEQWKMLEHELIFEHELICNWDMDSRMKLRNRQRTLEHALKRARKYQCRANAAKSKRWRAYEFPK